MAETRFEGRSPVARYWLSKCEGFAVTGGTHGVVEELIRDADPFVTTRLVVRTGRRRRAVVPADAVAAVDPAERVVFVARRARQQRGRAAIMRAAAGARRGGAGIAFARREMTTRAAPAVGSAGRTTVRAAAITAASTKAYAPKVAARTSRALARARRETATRAVPAIEHARRHAPKVGGYVRRRLAPFAAVVLHSFSVLFAEAAATARMASLPRVRRQLTDGSSGIRDTSS